MKKIIFSLLFTMSSITVADVVDDYMLNVPCSPEALEVRCVTKGIDQKMFQNNAVFLDLHECLSKRYPNSSYEADSLSDEQRKFNDYVNSMGNYLKENSAHKLTNLRKKVLKLQIERGEELSESLKICKILLQ